MEGRGIVRGRFRHQWTRCSIEDLDAIVTPSGTRLPIFNVETSEVRELAEHLKYHLREVGREAVSQRCSASEVGTSLAVVYDCMQARIFVIVFGGASRSLCFQAF
eukprot:764406-Hanusia_phi.AAC.3